MGEFFQVEELVYLEQVKLELKYLDSVIQKPMNILSNNVIDSVSDNDWEGFNFKTDEYGEICILWGL